MRRVIVAFFLIAFALPAHAEDKPLRLYRLDCGAVTVADFGVFADTGDYDGKEKELVSSCYLIRHGDQWMLWDAGLPAAIAQEKDGLKNGPFTLRLPQTLPEQIKMLKLTPQDIDYVGVSHAHFDHTGGAPDFTAATLVIQQAELDFLKNPEQARRYHMEPDHLAAFLKDAKKIRALSGDADLFGDGRVMAISLPGHTPGHMALLLKLESGPVILSGDQFHCTECVERNTVPDFNYDRAESLSSSDRLKRLADNLDATLIVQHEARDVGKVPAFPGYLE